MEWATETFCLWRSGSGMRQAFHIWFECMKWIRFPNWGIKLLLLQHTFQFVYDNQTTQPKGPVCLATHWMWQSILFGRVLCIYSLLWVILFRINYLLMTHTHAHYCEGDKLRFWACKIVNLVQSINTFCYTRWCNNKAIFTIRATHWFDSCRLQNTHTHTQRKRDKPAGAACYFKVAVSIDEYRYIVKILLYFVLQWDTIFLIKVQNIIETPQWKVKVFARWRFDTCECYKSLLFLFIHTLRFWFITSFSIEIRGFDVLLLTESYRCDMLKQVFLCLTMWCVLVVSDLIHFLATFQLYLDYVCCSEPQIFQCHGFSP